MWGTSSCHSRLYLELRIHQHHIAHNPIWWSYVCNKCVFHNQPSEKCSIWITCLKSWFTAFPLLLSFKVWNRLQNKEYARDHFEEQKQTAWMWHSHPRNMHVVLFCNQVSGSQTFLRSFELTFCPTHRFILLRFSVFFITINVCFWSCSGRKIPFNTD